MNDIQKQYMKQYLNSFVEEIYHSNGKTLRELMEFTGKVERDQLIELRAYITTINEGLQATIDKQPARKTTLEAQIAEGSSV